MNYIIYRETTILQHIINELYLSYLNNVSKATQLKADKDHFASRPTWQRLIKGKKILSSSHKFFVQQ